MSNYSNPHLNAPRNFDFPCSKRAFRFIELQVARGLVLF
jgi:hypothetical protein